MGAPGLLIGSYAGATDSPDTVTGQQQQQNTNQTQSSQGVSQTTFGPMSEEQRQLQQQSLQNYLQQQALADQYQNSIMQAQGLQTQAQGNAMNILNGQAFQLTPQEQQAIEAQRQAIIAQSQQDVGQFLDQRFQQLASDAGQRGVRGQAYTQLQGDQMRQAGQQLSQATNQANLMAAQQSLSQPYSRVAAQSPFIQQGATLADQMRLQAQQNRVAAQNPYLLQQLQQERLASGTTRTSNIGNTIGTTDTTGTNTQYGEKGSFRNALIGGYQGASNDAKTGAQLASLAAKG